MESLPEPNLEPEVSLTVTFSSNDKPERGTVTVTVSLPIAATRPSWFVPSEPVTLTASPMLNLPVFSTSKEYRPSSDTSMRAPWSYMTSVTASPAWAYTFTTVPSAEAVTVELADESFSSSTLASTSSISSWMSAIAASTVLRSTVAMMSPFFTESPTETW